MEELLYFLSSIHPLSDALIDHLSQIIRFRKFHRKEYLLRAGHTASNISFIHKGLLRCFYIKDDVEICSWFMKEGDVVISVESFLNQTPSYESIQTIEETECFYIDHKELETIYLKFPEFNFIARVLYQKYYTLSEQRLFSLRMQRSSERYDFLLVHHPELILRVPSKYIASYLGMAESYFSRIKGK